MQSTGDDDGGGVNGQHMIACSELTMMMMMMVMMMMALVNISLRAEHWFKGRSLMLSITPTDCKPF